MPRMIGVGRRNRVASSIARSCVLSPISASATTAVEVRSEEHTSELQSLMRISYAVFCLKKKLTAKQTYPIASMLGFPGGRISILDIVLTHSGISDRMTSSVSRLLIDK